ncbi:hypothetical protein DFJ73DRAFT_782572 [Zopfochytrium polystomum]|nr:hypothetical protein DFJ73DRAFT_782572 [Zopfochytrium polystomum]
MASSPSSPSATLASTTTTSSRTTTSPTTTSTSSTAVADPFTLYGPPVAGQPWLLPPASELAALPRGSPGYGCTVSPLLPVGAALYNASTIADVCPRGFFCPYYNVSDPDTVPVACPATVDCALKRLYGDLCLFLSDCPSGRTVETHYGLLACILAVDLLFAFLFLLHRLAELRRWNQPWTIVLPPPLRAWFGLASRSPVSGAAAKAAVPVEPDAEGQGEPPVDPATADDLVSAEATAAAAAAAGEASVLLDGFRRGFAGVENAAMNFHFEDLGLTLPSGATVLKGVNGEIKAGTMTAIMGPSGAGKTTFMNVLMGKVKRTGGELRINGVVAEMETFQKIIGYVPQEDIMLRELTVRENIEYSAKVRLPSSWSRQEVDSHIDNVLAALSLTGVANSQIGDELTRGISGGQRKRVNIGLELAAVPVAIFLDEPTSGLDATAALDVARNLRAVARLGLTVVSVIHQPRVEIFETFDDVLMIAPGGRTAYIGPVELARPYFERLGFRFKDASNPADVLMDILVGKGVARAAGKVRGPDEIVSEWERNGVAAVEALRNGQELPGPGAEAFLEAGAASTSSSSSSEADVAAAAVEAGDIASVAGSDKTDHEDHSAAATSPPPPPVDALKQISKTRGAGFWMQVLYAHNRSLLQQARFMNALWLELFVALFAGFVMGIASTGKENYKGVLMGPMAILSAAATDWNVGLFGLLIGIAVVLAAGPAAVKVFGEEKSVYFREAASGHSRSAYYLGKAVSSLYRIVLASGHFAAVFYMLARPTFPVGMQYLLIFLNFFVVYGFSIITSMIVPRRDAPLVSVIVGLILAVFCGYGPSLGSTTSILFGVSGNRWAAEAQFSLWIDYYTDIYDTGVSASLFGYTLHQTTRNVVAMVTLGILYRVAGFVLMISLDRDKQR